MSLRLLTDPKKKGEEFRFKLGTQLKVKKDITLKAKINNNTKFTVSSKFKYNNNLTVIAGTQINLLDPSSFFTNKTIPIPLGINLEFSYN